MSHWARKCIDGVTKERNFWQKNLCISKKESAPWLALDYGEGNRVSVEKVTLFTSSVQKHWAETKNVQIRLSNEIPFGPNAGKTMISSGKALGSFEGPSTRGQIVEIHSGPGWEKKTGRYLIIQMNFGKLGNSLKLHEAYAVGIVQYVATYTGKQ